MLDEARVDQVEDGYERSPLSPREKALLAFADAFLAAGTAPDSALRATLRAHFSDTEIVELTAGLALFMGFSKIAIAMGGIPAEMPTMKTPMPGA